MTSTATGSVFSAPAGNAVLAALRENVTTARAVDVERAELVVAWVGERAIDPATMGSATGGPMFDPDEHEGLPVPDEHAGLPVEYAGVPGTEQPMRLAGDGAPLVSDLEFTRLATALGQSNEAALAYVGVVVELAYRLPQLWERVRAEQVSIHRARTVTRMSKRLPFAGAAWVDAQVAWTIGSCTVAQIERTVSAAMATFDPDQAAKDEQAALEGRHFDIRLDEAGTTAAPGSGLGVGSVVRVEGGLDLADALDLEAAVSDQARALAGFLPGTSENVRRSIAVGDLARGHTTLPIPETTPGSGAAGNGGGVTGPDGGSTGGEDPAGGTTGGTGTTGPSIEGATGATGGMGRTVMLYLHLPADALNDHTGAGADGAGNVFGSGIVGRCENTKSPVSKEQIRQWCATAGRILVRPVIDLAGHTDATTYEASPTLRERIILRDGRCRFPYCNRSARSADLDHSVPYDQGGRTSSVNMAALCRRHHRAKTHTGWSYSMITPGVYYWAAPDGVHYLVTPSGTYPIPTAGNRPRNGRGSPRGSGPPESRPDQPHSECVADPPRPNLPGHTDPPPD
ncbi:HNH endonuclease [Ruania alba]|uniref:HNH endonuclease n=1 Tax=Ruania alba TaxID=648782 RepID=A0A1H5NEZ8_9MICO|nr:HNH endonuclease signature motif containing protein [Ruania alba]SEE99427.1 HNH endonuclease [Ruania alba]